MAKALGGSGLKSFRLKKITWFWRSLVLFVTKSAIFFKAFNFLDCGKCLVAFFFFPS